MLRKSASIAAFIALMAAAAHAATLTNIQGSVLVNDKPASENMQVAPGDRVSVVQGSVQIDYGGGSVTDVSSGQTVVVAPQPPASASGAPDISSTTLVIGGVAIAAGVSLAITLAQNYHAPASP